MAHFGDFSAAVKAADAIETGQPVEADTFDWFGAKIRLRPNIPPIAVTRFLAGLDRSNREAESALYRLLKQAIHEDDWVTFEDLAESNDVDAGGLLEVVNQIVAARAGRPTSQSDGSSRGSSTTTPTSTPASVPPAADPPSKSEQVAREIGIPTPPASRPDVHLALVRVDEEIPLEATG